MGNSLDWLMPEPEATGHTEAPEPGALFIRTSAKKTEALTCYAAETIEGLIMLMASGDWMETFITHILHGFRDGNRASPADILWDLRQEAEIFDHDVEFARRIARDYKPLLKSTERASETHILVGAGLKDPPTAEKAARKALKGKGKRAAKRPTGTPVKSVGR